MDYMGCHTWFYKKTEDPNLQQVVDELISLYQTEVDRLDKMAASPEYEKQGLLEQVKSLKKAWEDDISKIESGLTPDVEIYEQWASSQSGDLLSWVDGKGLYISSDDLPHDLFRKYGYPEIKLFSLEETLSYIYDKDNDCVIYEDTEESLRNFWEKYPDGMIEFG